MNIGKIQYKNGDESMADDTVYSDRLFQWDSQKYDTLCKKHFGNTGQYFYDRSPEKIQSFLRDYIDNQNLKLILIQVCINNSTGYPYWRFDYSLKKNKPNGKH